MTGSGGQRARDWRVWLGLGTIYLVWGGTYLAIRVMDRTVPPLLGSGARFLLAGGILSAALLARGGRERMRATPRQLAAAALLGMLLPAGGNGLVTVAERHVPAGLAALIIASVPLWVVVLRRLTGDRVARATAVGVGVGFARRGALLLPGNRPAGVTAAALLLVVLAAALWATGTFLSGRLPLPRDLLAATAIEMLIGGVVLAVAAIPAGELADVHPGRFNLGTAWSFAYLVDDRLAAGLQRLHVAAQPRPGVQGRHLRLRQPGGGDPAGLVGAGRGDLGPHGGGRGRDRRLGGDRGPHRVGAAGAPRRRRRPGRCPERPLEERGEHDLRLRPDDAGRSRRRSSVSSRWPVSRAWTCRIALASPATV